MEMQFLTYSRGRLRGTLGPPSVKGSCPSQWPAGYSRGPRLSQPRPKGAVMNSQPKTCACKGRGMAEQQTYPEFQHQAPNKVDFASVGVVIQLGIARNPRVAVEVILTGELGVATTLALDVVPDALTPTCAAITLCVC